MLKEENEKFKKYGISTWEKEAMETQLATAISEASFNLNEKTKTEQELKEALMRVEAIDEEIRKLKEVVDRAKAAEEETLVLKDKLRDENRKFKELEEEKTLIEASLRAFKKRMTLMRLS